MRVLCLEETGDGLLDLAICAQAHGHQVRYHLGGYDQTKHPTGRGLVERTSDWRASLRWCDLCVVGGNGKWMVELDRWRKQGVPMIGGNTEVAALELDRLAGMAAFKRAGIPVPPFRHCANLRDALAYVAKRDEGCAVKPCGSTGDKATSCVAKTSEEMVWRLERWLKEGKAFPEGVIVQDRIEGVEFAVGAWIGPGGFAEGWEENAEEKRFFPGGVGPNTGEMGTVMRLVKSSKLADKVLRPFEDRLVSLGYTGNIDVNTIIDDTGTPWPLEWTARLGWPSFNIELALHDGDPIEFLAGVADGKPPKSRRLNEVAVGVVLALPPYPFGHEKSAEVVGVPIWGATQGLQDRLHFCNVAMGEAPEISNGSVVSNRIERKSHLVTSGSYVLVATGTGESIVKARAQAHRAIDRLTIPASPFHRNDIGSRLRGELPGLQANGYARDLVYA